MTTPTNTKKTVSGDRVRIELKADSADMRMLRDAFKVMPKEAQERLRARNQLLVSALAHKMTVAAASAPNPKQAQLVARSIKPKRDRIPTIVIGGARRAPVRRGQTTKNPKPAYGQLLYGAEGLGKPSPRGLFPQGGNKFAPLSQQLGNGREGYFIYPTLRREQGHIRREFLETVYKLLREKWGPLG